MFMCEIASTILQQAEQKGGTRKSQKEKQAASINSFGRVLDVRFL